MREVNVITGAFSYTGKYITRRLLAMGKDVRTLTGHPDRSNPFGEQVQVFPFDFENPGALVKSLQGATTLYNTYWIRFSHGTTTFDAAVKNTLALFHAAQEAGVQRSDNVVMDAVGPDIFTFEQLVRLLAEKLQRRVGFVHIPPGAGFALARLLEPFVGDVLITRDEIAGLMADLLISQQPPTGHTHLTDWLEDNAQRVGTKYASELQRHYRH